jgi:hypothetical protein
MSQSEQQDHYKKNIQNAKLNAKLKKKKRWSIKYKTKKYYINILKYKD